MTESKESNNTLAGVDIDNVFSGTFASAFAVVQMFGDSKKVFMYRLGWNGNGLRVFSQVPDSNSMLTVPYLYIQYPDDAKTTPGLKAPWVPSQTDLFATDWVIGGITAADEAFALECSKIMRAVEFVDLKQSQGACVTHVIRMFHGKANPALVDVAIDQLRHQFRVKHFPNHVWLDRIIFYIEEMDREIRNVLIAHGFDVDFAKAFILGLGDDVNTKLCDADCHEIDFTQYPDTIKELVDLRARGIRDNVLVHDPAEVQKARMLADSKERMARFRAENPDDGEANGNEGKNTETTNSGEA
jgi:hypothetical protein